MALTLHAGSTNANAFKARIVAEYVGVEIAMPSEFTMGVTNKTPEFKKISPLGKVPVLETPEGPIFESNAIARYVARLKENNLLGTTVRESALIEQWSDFSSMEIFKNWLSWAYAKFPEGKEDGITQVKQSLAVLDAHLASRTFLVGNAITIADIIMACNLCNGFRGVFSKAFTAEFPHVERYFWTLCNQPKIKKIFGEIVQGSQEIPTPAPAQTKPKDAGSRRSSATADHKQPKVKEAPKSKETSKPKEKPKPKESVDDEEEEAPKPKAKNALDLLPPSPFVIDNWKRLYSNTKAKDFAEVAIKGFWEMYDPEGWSFWFSDYKYNEENDKTYVTMNKVGGFLQRLDFIRKYAFGKMLILGAEPPYKIKGVWLFRGQGIPQQMLDECYDVELYTWTKADLSSEEQKSRINAYFEEPDVIDGEKLLEAKCFK